MRNKIDINWSEISGAGLKLGFKAATVAVPAYLCYALAYSTYDRHSGEINMLINQGNVWAVDSGDSKVDFVHGWHDKVVELPGRPVFFTLQDYDYEWSDVDGDELLGVMEASYQFVFKEGDEYNNRYLHDYQKLYNHFDLNAAKLFSHREENGALILEEVRARLQSAVEQEFVKIKSEDFPDLRREIASRVIDSINDEFINLRWPIRLKSVDLNDIRISPEAEQRRAERPEPIKPSEAEPISQNVSIDVFVNQAGEFLTKVEEQGYSPEIASEMFCMYLNENTKHEGNEPMNCMRPQIIMPEAE